MSDVALSRMVAFMVARTRVDAAGYVGFARPDRLWSGAGLRYYAAIREEAEARVAEAVALGFTGVCLEDGVAVAVRPGDPRPHWPILDDAAVDLYAAQTVRLAAER